MTTIEPYTVLRTARSVYGERVVEVMVAGGEVEDGGKWALYCEHPEDTGVLQDTNRRRLWPHARETDQWCPFCQEIRDGLREEGT